MASANPYESDALLHQYLVFHYAPAHVQFPNKLGAQDGLHFPERCVAEGFDFDQLAGRQRALDLGCAVGRSTFELARHFDEVQGIDYSQRFIDAARVLQQDSAHPARVHIEGDHFEEQEVQAPPHIEPSRVSFEAGDAQNLRDDLGDFDAVLAANLLCRLPQPHALLERLPGLVRPGGQLVLTTPFTWLEEYTPREHWLGNTGAESFAELQSVLGPHFELLASFDLPFLIREHARKFQYGIALASRWTRREN